MSHVSTCPIGIPAWETRTSNPVRCERLEWTVPPGLPYPLSQEVLILRTPEYRNDYGPNPTSSLTVQ
jgi:hypothetical protein